MTCENLDLDTIAEHEFKLHALTHIAEILKATSSAAISDQEAIDAGEKQGEHIMRLEDAYRRRFNESLLGKLEPLDEGDKQILLDKLLGEIGINE